MIEQWQELKETITELRDNDGTGTQQEVCKFLANLMNVLEKQMSSSENPNKWIPISERLPNAHEEILATYEVEDGSRIAITGYGKYGFLVGNVTAWMPLPEPYKAESEEV